MDAVKIMATAIVGVMLALVLKEQKPYMGIALVVICTFYIFFLGLPYIDKILSYVRTLYSAVDGDGGYMVTILKITGISVIASLTASLCRDSGMSALANVVGISAKGICMCLTLPVMADFFRNILSVLP